MGVKRNFVVILSKNEVIMMKKIIAQLPLISCGEIRSIGALFWRKQTVFHRKI